MKDGGKKALRDRQLTELVYAIEHYRKVAHSKPLTLQGSEYPQAVQELNKAIDPGQNLSNSRKGWFSRSIPAYAYVSLQSFIIGFGLAGQMESCFDEVCA